MPYKIYLKSSAERELAHLPDNIHDRIVNRLFSLSDNPRPKGSKKLLSQEGYRIRVGEYRILYRIYKKEKRIEVVSIVHRKEVYRW